MAEASKGYGDRPTKAEYPSWLRANADSNFLRVAKNRHDAVGEKIRADVLGSTFWKEVTSLCAEWNDQYVQDTDFQLFVTDAPPSLHLKPYDSVLDKSFRKNILLNEIYPKPPEGNWICPSNWYSRLNDITRTTFIVKYLDGVKFLVDKIETVADRHGLAFSKDFEAKDRGYYAAHCYVQFEIQIPTLEWSTEATHVKLELQITTQLQDVIRKLTHDQYADSRSLESPSTDMKWQWDYKSREFVPNYLGHILHYVEGMIMEVRDRGERS